MKKGVSLRIAGTRGLFLILMAILLQIMIAAAISAPVDQNFSEFDNITGADNIAEMLPEFNSWVGGLFGIVLLFVIFIVTVLLSNLYTQKPGASLALAMFIVSISSVFLKIVGMVPDDAIYISFPIFLLILGFAIVTKS